MEQQQTCAQEAEDQAFANARRLFEMRKKLRRTSRTSSVCSRQSIVSMRHVLQPSEIGSESDLANGRRSGGESEGQGDSDSGGASDDVRRGQDMHWRSWRSFTSTLSGGSDGNLEKATSCDSHSKREKPQEQDSDDADKVSRPPLDIAEPFATRNCASQTLAIHTGAGDDTPPLNWTRKISMGDKIPLSLGFCSHESSCEVKEAGVQDAAVPRTCICICNTVHVETNTTSSQTPHMWQTEVVKQRCVSLQYKSTAPLFLSCLRDFIHVDNLCPEPEQERKCMAPATAILWDGFWLRTIGAFLYSNRHRGLLAGHCRKSR